MNISMAEILQAGFKLATEVPAEVAIAEAELDAGQSVPIEDAFRVTVDGRKLSVSLSLKEVK